MKFVLLLLVVAICAFDAFAAPSGPCVTAGQIIYDCDSCQDYYVCDAFLTPQLFVCPGSTAFYKDSCILSRDLAGCTS
ncbi:hypothetical protein CHUAL_001089 [Chamberlinius hualienensis]